MKKKSSRSLGKPDPLASLLPVARAVESKLKKHKITLTMGGEPSYIPEDCSAPEWNYAALGGEKMAYGRAFAEALTTSTPGAAIIESSGKFYPGEVNARWALHLIWNRSGRPFGPTKRAQQSVPTEAQVSAIALSISKALKLQNCWMRAESSVWILPLDHEGERWKTQKWPLARNGKLRLTKAEGSAGLRLPLADLPGKAIRRALVLELRPNALEIFLPPISQSSWNELLKVIFTYISDFIFRLSGYIPSDDDDLWTKLSVTPDPGVIEINLPPCSQWTDYALWIQRLENSAHKVGLKSSRTSPDGCTLGTGGGNHLLFGGASFEKHPFFPRPGWVASFLRYWQRHPSLAYLFTGQYVGPSSQAPRPDESARDLYDLEMAYRFMETLPAGGDHRLILSETLRHLHTDTSGNAHRCESSFDKFWNPGFEGGCRGLVEFRALESLPHSEWMSAVALLWRAIIVAQLEHPTRTTLIEWGTQLHDRFFMPSHLWSDLSSVLDDLSAWGFKLPREVFRSIWDWRFPKILNVEESGELLEIRKSCEGWPLLCETPLLGGSTSRFVDTSMERLEVSASPRFAKRYGVFIQNRKLPLTADFPEGKKGAGLRYRRTALYPSLHPGLPPHQPLVLSFTEKGRVVRSFQLEHAHRDFIEVDKVPLLHGRAPIRTLKPGLLTYDLRLDGGRAQGSTLG